MICRYCDKNIPEQSLYCPFCGEYLNTKPLEGKYCALSGKKIEDTCFHIAFRHVTTYSRTVTWGWYNQYSRTYTRGYDEYYYIDDNEYEKYKHTWRYILPLALTIVTGATTFLALLYLLDFSRVWQLIVEPNVAILFGLIMTMVVWYFMSCILFCLLLIPFEPKLKEIGVAEWDDVVSHVLKQNPSIRKKHETLRRHGCYEDANSLIKKHIGTL